MPCYGSIHPKVYRSHMAAMAGIAKLGYQVNMVRVNPKFVAVTNKMGLAAASNYLVESALQMGVDYVFWTEMDMDVPADVIPRLLDAGKDVCGGLYFLRNTNDIPFPCVYVKGPMETVKDDNFLFVPVQPISLNRRMKVHAIGCGCVLIKTTVFNNPIFNRGDKKVWFDEVQGKCGQDMYFYEMLRRGGQEVWIDTGVICKQYNEGEPEEIGYDQYAEAIKEHRRFNAGFIGSR